ncbi:hypothetical protein U6A24_18935 [Aquimarina gracilis]|uniref:Bacteriocin-like protein n=1 Tax=Aquimarina gracilis TaxID=874422 RepID=A0ABU6A091_9FLAO|nr:hypothetical protein [Aquimarina gracilis]MEB3347559.1 hypothetical protein [Aquimarina gracilis]
MKKGNAKKLELNKIKVASLSDSKLKTIMGGGDGISWILKCGHGQETKTKIDFIDEPGW